MAVDVRRKNLPPAPSGVAFESPRFKEWLEDLHFEVSRRPRVIVERVPLSAVDSAGGVFAWEGPKSGTSYTRVLIHRVIVDIQTASTGACTIDVGTAASATTSSDNLIDGQSIASGNTLLDNIDNQGTNGESKQLVYDSVPFITCSVSSGASAGLVGRALVEYVVI